jgi:RHS repeat-associated protein
MISSANSATGISGTYIYNALGQVIEANSTNNGIKTYIYDEAGHYLGTYNGAGTLGNETVWLGDIPVGIIRSSGSTIIAYYVHTDHLNTPRQVTRPSDNLQMTTWFSDPFGTTAANVSPQGATSFPVQERFPGQISTSGIGGLILNYFRDYDPATGRYVESDPVGLIGGVNTYAYVASDPIGSSDQLGLAKAKTNGRWSNCTSADRTYCEKECGSRGVKSCKKWWYKSPAIGEGGAVVVGWKPAPKPSCNCNESFCDRNPNTCRVGAAAGIGALIVGAIALPEFVLPACAAGGLAGAAAQ